MHSNFISSYSFNCVHKCTTENRFFKVDLNTENKKSPFVRKGLFVVPLGLEPRLFWTKTRRVASYTMGQFHNVLHITDVSVAGAKITTKFNFTKKDGEFSENNEQW